MTELTDFFWTAFLPASLYVLIGKRMADKTYMIAKVLSEHNEKIEPLKEWEYFSIMAFWPVFFVYRFFSLFF
jgi:hypothetical protein